MPPSDEQSAGLDGIAAVVELLLHSPLSAFIKMGDCGRSHGLQTDGLVQQLRCAGAIIGGSHQVFRWSRCLAQENARLHCRRR